MPQTLPFRHVGRLSLAEWGLLAEALGTLALASLAIRLLPFRKVAGLASRRALDGPAGARDARRRTRYVRWAVNAWGRRVPWRAVCFQRGLAAHLMLRRRGIASSLHYGVAQTAEEGLLAHVWVSVDGDIVMGGEEAPRFACLTSFPATAAEAGR
jgi:hypothetical protein